MPAEEPLLLTTHLRAVIALAATARLEEVTLASAPPALAARGSWDAAPCEAVYTDPAADAPSRVARSRARV